MFKKILITTLPVLFCSHSYAEVPNTFTAGNIIVAAEMNENFTSLEDRIAAIESQIGIGKTYTEMLSDSSYTAQFIYTANGDNYIGGDGKDIQFLSASGSATIAFNTGGSASGSSVGEEYIGTPEMDCGHNITDQFINNDGSISSGAVEDLHRDPLTCTSSRMEGLGTVNGSFTDSASEWSVDDSTGILTIVYTEDDGHRYSNQYLVSDDGSILFNLGISVDQDEYETEISTHVMIMRRNK